MKKIISIILAAAMMLSLIPSVFATGEETPIKIVYNFKNKGVFGETETTYDLTKLSYAASNGFWAFGGSSAGDSVISSTPGVRYHDTKTLGGTNPPTIEVYGLAVQAPQNTRGNWIAYKLYVPKAGEYKFDLEITNNMTNATNAKATNINAFAFKATGEADIASIISGQNGELNGNCTARRITETISLGQKELDEGEYYFVINPYNTAANGWLYPHSLTLTEDGTGTELVPIISSLTKTSNEDGTTTVKAEAKKMSDSTTDATNITYTYAVADDDVALASVDAETGVVTGLADGTAIIIATATKEDGLSSSKSIEVAVTAPVAEEPEDKQVIADAFTTEEPTAIAYNPSVSGAGYNASEDSTTVAGITATLQEEGDYKDSYKMYAPKTSGDAQFLYWAKGLSAYKKIVSYENEFYYTPAGGDNNVLIAVYDEVNGTSNKAEFYNANGQLIKLITDTSEDKTVPVLPSMAGYNNASSWKQYNGETVATAGSELKPEGTMIFVAQYESEKPIDVTVTVENGNGTATVPYGEFVTCTPDTSKGQLKWWKKEVNGVSEIVSIDDTYKFRAWETCTVTAEYADKKPDYIGNTMKIIIDTFTAGNEKAVMAEFIGFGADTVEKGIIYNGTKIAMTKPGNQFTVTGVANDTFNGYAIVKDGTSYNLIVDGEATISNAE